MMCDRCGTWTPEMSVDTAYAVCPFCYGGSPAPVRKSLTREEIWGLADDALLTDPGLNASLDQMRRGEGTIVRCRCGARRPGLDHICPTHS